MGGPISSLVVTRFRPHRPSGGGALRNTQNIQALARLGPVDVVSLGLDEAGDAGPGVREWTAFSLAKVSDRRGAWERIRRRFWPLRRGVHPDVDLYDLREVQRWLLQTAARRHYDVALVEELCFAHYVTTLRHVARRVVYDAHNVESVLWDDLRAHRSSVRASARERLKQRLLRGRMATEESRAVCNAHVVWACSERDAGEIVRLHQPAAPVVVVPNGVNVDAYPRASALTEDADWRSLPLNLVYLGSFPYAPNEDAALRLINEVLPAIRARGHQARLVLVGRNPTPAMQAAAVRDAGIILTGFVESIGPFLDSPCIVTLPITLGSGTRLKILEAFAAGRPVVSTRKGAEGIEAEDGRHILLRETPDDIADAVIRLWNSADERTQLCRNAFDLVRARYSWSMAAQVISTSLGARPVEVCA